MTSHLLYILSGVGGGVRRGRIHLGWGVFYDLLGGLTESEVNNP